MDRAGTGAVSAADDALTQAQEAAREQRLATRARRVWTGIVLGFLGFTLSAQALLVINATGDPSVVAEPDYYRKAVDWDARREQARQNATLGWRLELRQDADGELTTTLRDAAGFPLSEARVEVEAFHKADRATVLRCVASEATPGSYSLPLRPQRTGLWELRFTVTRGAERFTHVVERDLSARS